MSYFISRFRSSMRCLHDVRCLSVTAMFVALSVAITMSGLTIRISSDLRIGFSFICSASIGFFFGPAVSMISGICTDILGYFAGNFTMGGYFPGHTLTAALTGLIYGLWLYHPNGMPKRKLNRFLCVFGAKLCVNLFCNSLLTTFWLVITQGNAMSALLPLRLAKNVIFLPLECIMLYFAIEFFIRIKQNSSFFSYRQH